MIFWSLLDLTNSLLMNRPSGWVHFLPLGAVSSTCMFLSAKAREKKIAGVEEKALVRVTAGQEALLTVARRDIEETNLAGFRHDVGETWLRELKWNAGMLLDLSEALCPSFFPRTPPCFLASPSLPKLHRAANEGNPG